MTGRKRMRVVEFPRGEHAPAGADRIVIHRLGEHEFKVVGALIDTRVIEEFSPPPFKSEQEALDAALAWARQHHVRLVYVERR